MFLRYFVVAVLCAVTFASPGRGADGDVAALEAALHLDDVFAVMRDEGLAYGEQTAADMFPNPPGPSWSEEVGGIYAVDRVLPMFKATFEGELARKEEDVPAMLAFFGSDLGRKVTTLVCAIFCRTTSR